MSDPKEWHDARQLLQVLKLTADAATTWGARNAAAHGLYEGARLMVVMVYGEEAAKRMEKSL